MKFKPMTEEDVQREQLCPEGKAPFTVLEATDTESKSGKPMTKLKLNVHATDGDYHCYDYISPEFMAFKHRHFWCAIGREDLYMSGDVDANMAKGAQGWCEVGVKKDPGYGLKNVISDYLVESDKAKATEPEPERTDDDDVPF